MSVSGAKRGHAPPVNAEFKILLDHWRDIRGERALPRKSDLRLATLKPVLREVSLFEWVAGDEIIWRLAGTSVVQRHERDPTWSNLLDFVPEAAKEAVSALVNITLRHPCGLMLTYGTLYSSGKVVETESLVLPFSDDSDTPRFIMVLDKEGPLREFRHETGRTSIAETVDRALLLDLGFGVPAKLVAAGAGSAGSVQALGVG